MKLKYLLAASVVSLSAAAVLPAPVMAQQITSGIEGQVQSADGTAIAGAAVVIRDERTAQERSIRAGADGSFRVTNLVPGGPYTITATAPGFEGQTVTGSFISLQGNTSYSFRLSTSETDLDNVIVVSGARANVTQLAIGPGQSFGLDSLEGFPSISRDIRDIIRIDPRVSLDRDSEVDRISCLGGNDRSNTFTVDGIIQGDSFGLTDTPFAARSALPVPFDVIRETSVEFAPFDVEYGQFTGCAINVVTKSGSNNFHGSAFFTFRNEDLRGNKLQDASFTSSPFEEKRWGATLSGPVIKDRLFFFAGYEETSLPNANDTGPFGGGFANELNYVTQTQFDQFAQIANDVYGQDVGGFPTVLPESSVRYFGRLDAYITDVHRIEATYQHLDEINATPDLGSNNATGLNSYNNQGTLSDYYSVRLFSNWTDGFSTEIRASRSDITDRQDPFGFNEAQDENPTVRLAVGVTGPGNDGIIGTADDQDGILSTGPSIFRSANALEQTVDQLKLKANLISGNHDMTFGGEVNRLDAFNLFAINATGTLFFRSLADFSEGYLTNGSRAPSTFATGTDLVQNSINGGIISATPTGDINEAGATFRRTIYTAYAQDKWQATDQLNLLIGVRVDWYDGSAPRANPLFAQRYGFTNRTPFSNFDPLFLPRFGFTYNLDNEGFFKSTVVKGGVGIFGGGDPTVWFSNAFSNNGFSTGTGTTLAATCSTLPRNSNGQIDVVVGGQFSGFPQCAADAGSAVAAAGNASVQSIDPELKLPSVMRANIGIATRFGTETGFFSDWSLNLDYIYSKFLDPLNWAELPYVIDTNRGLNGFTADGRPIYRGIDALDPRCNVTYSGPSGTTGTFSGVTSACLASRRTDEIQLTNAGSFESHVASAVMSKNFGGFLTANGNLRVNIGYAYTDAENRRASRSSTATSNFGKSAYFDVQDPEAATSNYQTAHNITFAANLREEFFGDYGTELGFVFVARSGRPYSLTFDGSPFNNLSSSRDSALLYIPTGISDPNLSQSSTPAVQAARDAAVTSLIEYVNGTNCKFTPGETIKANTCRADWFYDLDMRVSQELPGFGGIVGVKDRFTLFADFDNVLNLLNNSWNVFNTVPGGTFRNGDGSLVDVVDGGVDSQGRYIISGFDPDDATNRVSSASIWKIQVGVRYEF